MAAALGLSLLHGKSVLTSDLLVVLLLLLDAGSLSLSLERQLLEADLFFLELSLLQETSLFSLSKHLVLVELSLKFHLGLTISKLLLMKTTLLLSKSEQA